MTTGEMLELTKRLNSIVSSRSGWLKLRRLLLLKADMEEAYSINLLTAGKFKYSEPSLYQLHNTVEQEVNRLGVKSVRMG